jgi:hypothetical protein
MTEPLTRNRVDIKAILADPLLREELIEGATDFICKVEGIRPCKGDLEMTELSPQAQAVLDAWSDNTLYTKDKEPQALAAALRAAADQVVPEETWLGTEEPYYAYYQQRWDTRRDLLAIAAELEGVTSR